MKIILKFKRLITSQVAWLCLYVLLICCGTAQAKSLQEYILTGTVIDSSTHQPLAGATVFIPDLHTGTICDSAGHYTINHLPAGDYLVEVRFIGYRTVSREVRLRQKTTVLNFTLSPSLIEQNEVVITGQSRATAIRNTPIPVIAVNHRYLQENLGTNIISSLTKIPGISAVSTGPNVAKPFIRGLGYNRILTLYDGQRQEDQQWGDEHGIAVDEYSIDRVEVIKGPASLTYGSDALAGVINLIPTQPAPEGHTIGSFLNEYQTNNNLIGNSLMFSGNHHGLGWVVRGSHKMAKDYRNKVDGRVYATNFQETDFTALLSKTFSWGSSHVDLTYFDDLQGIPDGSRDSATRRFTKQITEADTFRPIVPESELNSYRLPVLHQHIQHSRIYWANSINIGQSELQVNLGFEQNVRREYSHPQYPAIPGLYMILNTFTYDLKYNLNGPAGWQTTFGLNGMYQHDNVTKGTEFIIPSYRELDGGLFAMTQKTWNQWTVMGGLRLDHRNFHQDALYTFPNPITGFDQASPQPLSPGQIPEFADAQHTYSGLSGSLGVSYRITPQLTLKANLARGYRAPNIVEVSANGVHPGTDIYQIGNSNFRPEFSQEEDLGLSFASEHVSVDLSLFNNDIQHYIYNAKVLNSEGQDSVIVPGNQTFMFRQGHARLYGGEFHIDIHPHPLDWLHVESNLSTVTGLNLDASQMKFAGDSAKYLPFIPPLHGLTEIRANIRWKHLPLKNTYVAAQAEYYATQNHVMLAYNTETPTPGYTLFNVLVGTELVNHKGKPYLQLALFADNIFNRLYQNHLSRLKYMEPYPDDPRPYHGIYNMGRNIGIRATIPFSL
ncbi:MAG: TonB-dependent receptor [Thermoflavifilum aggregans]|nr:TonB-dependent receptor [Thermoflavifilum aggregans]